MSTEARIEYLNHLIDLAKEKQLADADRINQMTASKSVKQVMLSSLWEESQSVIHFLMGQIAQEQNQ